MTDKVKKLVLLNLPYLIFVYLFDKLCQGVRLAPGADASEKLLHIGQGFSAAFASLAPSFHLMDLCVGAAGVAPAPAAPAEATATQSVSATTQEIMDQTNVLRREYGLAPLAADELLMEAAQVRADEMAATGTYSYTRPDGTQYYTVTDCPYVTENIHRLNQEWLDAMDLELADAAVQDWAESSGHLDHMVSGKVDAIGVGVAEGTDDQGRACWYCVQLFRYTGQEISWVDAPVG